MPDTLTEQGYGRDTFEEARSNAHRLLGDAEDWLRSDWTRTPTLRQVRALREAQRSIAMARGSLDDAARQPGERREAVPA